MSISLFLKRFSAFFKFPVSVNLYSQPVYSETFSSSLITNPCGLPSASKYWKFPKLKIPMRTTLFSIFCFAEVLLFLYGISAKEKEASEMTI